jgi:hypothetical protein
MRPITGLKNAQDFGGRPWMGVLVQRLLASGTIQQGSRWFRKLAGVAIALFGIYFITQTFIDNRA